MKTPIRPLICFAMAAVGLIAADQPATLAQAAVAAPPDSPWRPQPPNPKAALLPRISVKGNRFVDPAGSTVLFRGLSIADPSRLVEIGHWNRDLFVAVQGMGANLVRIPVHPETWRKETPAGYLKLLDQAVDWCTDLGMYVIIDWHSIGNLETGMFQSANYDTSIPETFAFWRTIGMHFHGNHTVAFCELFNEPTNARGMLGTIGWTEWRELNEQMIGIIRYWDRETIPLVAGFDWAYDLDPIRYDPIRAEGIGYVVHPYANKRPQPWEPRWDDDFGFAAEHYPVIATEIGFSLKPGEVVDDSHYGNRITRYLEQHGISWMAWVFDPQWRPQMLSSFDGFALTGGGEFFKLAMHRPPEPPLKRPAH